MEKRIKAINILKITSSILLAIAIRCFTRIVFADSFNHTGGYGEGISNVLYYIFTLPIIVISLIVYNAIMYKAKESIINVILLVFTILLNPILIFYKTNIIPIILYDIAFLILIILNKDCPATSTKRFILITIISILLLIL